MVDNVINAIVEAEKEAEQKVENANSTAETIVKEAIDKNKSALDSAKNIAQMDGNASLELQTLDAEEKVEDMLKDNKRVVEQIRVDALYKVEDAVDFICKQILGE